VCGVSCRTAGTTACGSACVRLQEDPLNCGACGNRCPTTANGTSECNAGKCKLRCNAGLKECDGTCSDTSTDLDHCGGCGRACGGLCVLGKCVLDL
jgi:hypothetical protein